MQASNRSFTITRCLGRGGFGEVYRARMLRDGGLDTDVALKVLRRDIDPDGQAVQRLRDEGRLLARLNHPAILKVHDLVVLEGRIALVTEYVDGDDLSLCLRGETPIPSRALLEAIAVVAGALATAWDAPGRDGPLHLVHRDIKPSNLRLSRHGGVKLLDFGIARSDADGVDRESRTRTGMMVGSPAYMAPERFTERTVHLGSDVFSLCAILFEGLTGQRFYGDLPIPMQVGLAVDDERFAAHLDAQLARIDDGPLRVLLAQGLAHDVRDRPSPHELGRRLDALAESMPGASLARYVRDRRWSDGVSVVGELEGQTLTESLPGATPAPPSSVETLAQPLPSAPTVALAVASSIGAPRPSRRRRWPWVVGGLAVVGLVGTVLLVLTGGLAALPFVLAGESTLETAPELPTPHPVAIVAAPSPTSAPAPVSPTKSAPVAPPAPVPEPAEAAPSAPVAASVPQPAPAPSPVTAPRPVADPTPAPTPAPTAPAAPTGSVALSGGVAALLVGPSGRHRLPGEVPVGTYRLQALFNGLDAVDVTSVTVSEGATLRVDCSASFTRCTVK